MVDMLLQPQNWIFSVVLFVALGLGVLEMLAVLLIGAGLSHALEALGLETPESDAGGVGGILCWINTGRLPMGVLIILFCGLFGLLGLLGQMIVVRLGWLWPAWLMGLVVFFPVMLMLRQFSRRVGPWFSDATSQVVSADGFVGRQAQVTIGPVTESSEGRAKLWDDFNTLHNVRILAGDHQTLEPGMTVLIFDRLPDGRFLAMPLPKILSEGE